VSVCLILINDSNIVTKKTNDLCSNYDNDNTDDSNADHYCQLLIVSTSTPLINNTHIHTQMLLKT
jgi:hypothetical protein